MISKRINNQIINSYLNKEFYLMSFLLIILFLFIPAVQAQEYQPGDVIGYTLDYQNEGNYQAETVEINNSIPNGTTYIYNSLTIDGVAQTDALDEDMADFIAESLAVHFLIPNIQPETSGYVSFRVQVNQDIALEQEIINQAEINYSSPDEQVSEETIIVPVGGIPVEEILVEEASEEETSEEEAPVDEISTEEVPSEEIPTEETPAIETPLEETPGEEKPTEEISGPIIEPIKDRSDFWQNIIPHPLDDFNLLINQLTNLIVPTKEFYQEKIIANQPLQTVNQAVALPVVTMAVVANTATSLPLATVGWPLFRYLWQIIQMFFTEPAYLFSKKKRRQWGLVYNSLTKQPIGLAVVRLYQLLSTGEKKLINTKVTGADGRYFFLVQSGQQYQLEVQIADFSFPSKCNIKQISNKEQHPLYLNQTIEFTSLQQPLINYDIPLDPVGDKIYLAMTARPIKTKINKLSIWQSLSNQQRQQENKLVFRAFRKNQLATSVAYLGPLLSLLCLFISPSIFTLILVIIHLFFLLIFRHLARRPIPHSWGEVYRQTDKQHLGKAIIRLFDKQYGKLLLTYVTQKDGRYGFLTGNDRYVLTCERNQYYFPEKQITVQGSKEKIVKRDLPLVKK